MNMRILGIQLFDLASSSVWADTWSAYVILTSVQPLTVWNGGAIRVQPITATNPDGCTSNYYYDFTYDSGTQETRAAVVAAIYMAFTTGKQIKFYVDGDKCSPADAPIIMKNRGQRTNVPNIRG